MFGNALDMRGHIDSTFNSKIECGVRIIRYPPGSFSGPGGVWVESGEPVITELPLVNIQAAKWKDIQILIGMGGTGNPEDSKIVHINDGVNYIYPNDDGTFSDILEFSDGLKMRKWRVMTCDNRPWRNFCRATVERYRGAG